MPQESSLHRFVELILRLEDAPSSNDRVRQLQQYFTQVVTDDAVPSLDILLGHRTKRLIAAPKLFLLLTSDLPLPTWLIDVSYDHVGDRSETLALLIGSISDSGASLHEFLSAYYDPLNALNEADRAGLIREASHLLSRDECLVWFKLITGTLRPKVSRSEIAQAIARISDVPVVTIEQRLIEEWTPTQESWRLLLKNQDTSSPAVYPFASASHLEAELVTLGNHEDWQLEYKWSGLRTHLIRDKGKSLLWSIRNEVITDRFPELTEAARSLPSSIVLDGHIVVWSDRGPLPVSILARRLARKGIARAAAEMPVVYVCYDLLKLGDTDLVSVPLQLRREQLEEIIGALPPNAPLILSPQIDSSSWDEFAAIREAISTDVHEGLMLKPRQSIYHPEASGWMKWNKPATRIKVVLLYAERGDTASTFSQYSFGVRHDEGFVPIAKVPLDLSIDEHSLLDAWIVDHAIDRFGPVRTVPPLQVFELEFLSIEESSKRKSGVVLHEPRVLKWLADDDLESVTSLQSLYRILRKDSYRDSSERR